MPPPTLPRVTAALEFWNLNLQPFTLGPSALHHFSVQHLLDGPKIQPQWDLNLLPLTAPQKWHPRPCVHSHSMSLLDQLEILFPIKPAASHSLNPTPLTTCLVQLHEFAGLTGDAAPTGNQTCHLSHPEPGPRVHFKSRVCWTDWRYCPHQESNLLPPTP